MRKILIFLNGIFIVWACVVLLYVATPVFSLWVMAEVYEKYGLLAWIMVNTCFVVQIVATVALIVENRALMNVCVPFLLFYGAGGLVIFDWSVEIIPLQILHLIMTVTVIYMLMSALKKLAIIKLAMGIVIGTVIFVSFKLYQNNYFKTHPEISKYIISEYKE